MQIFCAGRRGLVGVIKGSYIEGHNIRISGLIRMEETSTFSGKLLLRVNEYLLISSEIVDSQCTKVADTLEKAIEFSGVFGVRSLYESIQEVELYVAADGDDLYNKKIEIDKVSASDIIEKIRMIAGTAPIYKNVAQENLVASLYNISYELIEKYRIRYCIDSPTLNVIQIDGGRITISGWAFFENRSQDSISICIKYIDSVEKVFFFNRRRTDVVIAYEAQYPWLTHNTVIGFSINCKIGKGFKAGLFIDNQFCKFLSIYKK